MRQERNLFEKAIKLASYYSSLTGMHINYDQKFQTQSLLSYIRNRWIFFLNASVLTQAVICVFPMMDSSDVQRNLYMTPCMTISLLSVIKSSFFLYYECNIVDIINTLRTLQSIDESEDKEEVEREFIRKRLPFLTIANKSLLVMCSTGYATFSTGPLIFMIWYYWTTGEVKFFLPYIIWYPFDEYSFRGWPFAYLHQLWTAWNAVFLVYGTDCFFYTACTFIHNQICSLQYDMRKIGTKRMATKESFNKQIWALVHRHRELSRCIDLLNVTYGKSTLYNVVSSSFIICLAGFNMTGFDNPLMMAPFSAVMFLGFVQIYLFCYYGDLLMCASMEVSDAIFDSEWYELDASCMKCCLIILMRAQKPFKISAYGFSDINLNTFSRILSSAWSYFTLLRTMYSK